MTVREEFERARQTLPRRKFDMQYRGLIYESFDAAGLVVPRGMQPGMHGAPSSKDS